MGNDEGISGALCLTFFHVCCNVLLSGVSEESGDFRICSVMFSFVPSSSMRHSPGFQYLFEEAL